MKGIPLGLIIAGGFYFGFNLVLLGFLVADALRTSTRENGLTARHAMLALFWGLPLYGETMLLVWGLPIAFPDKFRVGGERFEDRKGWLKRSKILLSAWGWRKK